MDGPRYVCILKNQRPSIPIFEKNYEKGTKFPLHNKQLNSPIYFLKGKIDEIIKPVIKKLSVKNSQDRIDNFFSTTRISLPEKGHYQSSKRVKEAIGKVLGKNPENNESSSSIIVNNIPKNKNPTKRKSEESKNQQPSTSKKVKKSEEIKPKEIIVQPPKNWKQEEKSKAEEAKRKAIEVMKKTRQIENKKKSKKNKKYVGTNLKRKILPTHNLSESDSD